MNIEDFDGSLDIDGLANSINIFEAGTNNVVSSLVGFIDLTTASASGKNNWNKGSYVSLGSTRPSNIKLLQVVSPKDMGSTKADGIALGYTFAFYAPQIYVSDKLIDAVAFRS
jgi:hypothetical protein